MADEKIPQDTINFVLRADKIVTNDTVKVIVTVDTLSNKDTSERDLRNEIRSVLGKFIAGAEWAFDSQTRTKDSSGYERVTLRATTRIDEKENFKLQDRANDASRQGLTLSNVEVDNSIPTPMLEKAEKELRAALVKQAIEEAKEMATLTGRDYRLGSVTINNGSDPFARKMAMANTRGYAVAASAMGGSAGEDEEGLGNSQRLELSANIELRVFSIPAKA